MQKTYQTLSFASKTAFLRTWPEACVQKVVLACTLLASVVTQAQTPPADKSTHDEPNWQVGVVLDAGATSKALALGNRGKGLQLGHSDLTASGLMGSYFKAQLTGVAATHESKLETSLEEAWLETTSLPMGLQIRVGRFASQMGYQNAQHPHADDFIERPLLYRALLGGHWKDDGIRLNWTATTDKYLMVGVEAFRGKSLVADTANVPGALGAVVLSAKLGDDFNRSNSWQLGLSHVRNRREAALQEHHEEDQAGEGHDQHEVQFTGKNTWVMDVTWKWSPNGNNRTEQLKLNFENARTTGLNRYASTEDLHQSHALSAVWRFNPSWEVGVRTDWLKVSQPHETLFEIAKMREYALMVVYKPTHMQSVRVQYTTQRDVNGFESPAKNAVQLQYVLAFGAHGAHPF